MRRRRCEDGLGLVDLIIAATIFLLVIVAASYVAQESSISLASAREQTDASTLANNFLAMMAASNCGLSTGVDVTPTTPAATRAAQPGAPTAAQVEKRCKTVDGTKTIVGDPTPHRRIVYAGYSFTVTVATDWTLKATSGAAAGSSMCPGTTYIPPVGALRSIKIAWTPGASHTMETYPASGVLTTFTVTPQASVFYHNTSEGGAVFRGVESGGKVTLTVPGFSTVQRVASTGKCVWFPFLPPGTYKASYWPTGTSSGTALAVKTFPVVAGKNSQVTLATQFCAQHSRGDSDGNSDKDYQCDAQDTRTARCHNNGMDMLFTHCMPGMPGEGTPPRKGRMP